MKIMTGKYFFTDRTNKTNKNSIIQNIKRNQKNPFPTIFIKFHYDAIFIVIIFLNGKSWTWTQTQRGHCTDISLVVSPASTPTHLQKEKRKNFYGKFFAPNFIFRNTENIEHKQKTEEKIYENPQTFVNTITGGCHGDDLYCIHVDFFFCFLGNKFVLF